MRTNKNVACTKIYIDPADQIGVPVRLQLLLLKRVGVLSSACCFDSFWRVRPASSLRLTPYCEVLRRSAKAGWSAWCGCPLFVVLFGAESNQAFLKLPARPLYWSLTKAFVFDADDRSTSQAIVGKDVAWSTNRVGYQWSVRFEGSDEEVAGVKSFHD